MTYYKLTTQSLTTYNETQWVVGEWKQTNGVGKLCGAGWLRGYHSPELAVLLNPIHDNIDTPRLFQVEVEGEVRDDKGLKMGATKMRLVEELTLPVYTITQRVAFGILCAKEVIDSVIWNRWADAWLDGSDRSLESAEAAADAAARAAWATWAARAKEVWALWAVLWSAEAAARAAWAAEVAEKSIDLQKLAEEAKNY